MKRSELLKQITIKEKTLPMDNPYRCVMGTVTFHAWYQVDSRIPGARHLAEERVKELMVHKILGDDEIRKAYAALRRSIQCCVHQPNVLDHMIAFEKVLFSEKEETE
jgi:hypothetical protein